MTTKEYLKQLGLTERQQNIFLFISKKESSTVLMISRETSLPRSTIYLELDRLTSQGYIISKKVARTTLYSITNPRNIKHLLNEEKEKVNSLLGNIEDFITQIEESKKNQLASTSVNLYYDQKGIKQLLWNTLRMKEKHIYGYSPGKFEDIVDHKFAEKMRLEYMNRGITNRVILNDTVPLDWSSIPDYLKEFTQARTLEEKKIRFEHETLMYDDTMIVVSKKGSKNQYGVEITDPLLVATHKQLFEFIWRDVAKVIPFVE